MRRLMIARRASLVACRDGAAHAAAGSAALPLLSGARTVALYAAIAEELDPGPLCQLLAADGVTLVFPRVIPKDKVLRFFAVDPGADVGTAFERSRFGVMEPRATLSAVPLAQIDAFVIPGLAFDQAGNRLGWGAGYYDATLARAPHALRIGFAFSCQVVDQVPQGPADERVDAVVSERGALWFAPQASRQPRFTAPRAAS